MVGPNRWGSSDGGDGTLQRGTAIALRRLRRLGAPESDAEECVQEAWARIVEVWARRGWEEINLPNLLVVVARNQWIDRCRHRTRWQPVPLEHVESSSGGDIEARVAARMALSRVAANLQDEPERDRSVFAAVVLDERPVAEVAAEHGLGRSQGYAIVAGVRRRLATSLG